MALVHQTIIYPNNIHRVPLPGGVGAGALPRIQTLLPVFHFALFALFALFSFPVLISSRALGNCPAGNSGIAFARRGFCCFGRYRHGHQNSALAVAGHEVGAWGFTS